MGKIFLRYGHEPVEFGFEDSRFTMLDKKSEQPGLTDFEIGMRLDAPFASPPMEDIIKPGESLLFVVPDATRNAGAGQIVNLLLRRAIASGIQPHDIRIAFATGIHRPATEAEKREILTPFVAERIRTYAHSPRDLMRLAYFGETTGGIRIELSRSLIEHDHVILIGGVRFHYFAGFTGGRKLICPGLASANTISATHRLAFDCNNMQRSHGVGPGLLEGNPVNEAFIDAVSKSTDRINISFSVNTIVNEVGGITDLVCGNWQSAHREACSIYERSHLNYIGRKRRLVVADCGGFPYDINMIQAHKALVSAAEACEEGGIIILLAECRDGMGRGDLSDWFMAANSRELAEKLCTKYQVNGQTAWSLLQIAERFDVRIVTGLSAELCKMMRLQKFSSLAEALASLPPEHDGYIIPSAASLLIRPAEDFRISEEPIAGKAV